MHSLITKAKDLGLKGKEKIEQYSSGKLGSEDGSREASPSFSRKRREAALKADLFAGPDKIVSAGNTYGLIKLTVHEAKVPSEQRYCAVVSIGMQTYMSRTEPKPTGNPVFEEGHDLVLQRDGATRAHIALYSTGRPARGQFKKSLCGWCDIDLAAFFGPGGADKVRDGWYPLLDPSNSSKEAGQVRISTEAATLEHLAQQFWHRILAMADMNDDHQLSLDEFQTLMTAFGGEMSNEEVEGLFQRAGEAQNGTVGVNDLANLLQQHQLEGNLFKIIRRCPVSGADLIPGKDFENIIYMTLCMDEGTSHSLQGGFSTAEQATQSWMLKLSEWATQPLAGSWGHKYQAGGLNIGAKSAHILVYDRHEQRVIEELISPYMVLAMRNMYQTPVGRLIIGSGAHKALLDLTQREGRYMNSPASIKEIDKFLKTFGGQLDANDIADPLESFNTFNQFFYRKLKPSARPIADPGQDHVVVSACDARLTAFYGLSDATRCWIKGRQFSMAGLLADQSEKQQMASQFEGGCMMIYRLAPQDYHRFHFLTKATLVSITNVPGRLYTVNPIAINSPFANVLTQNKRAICMYDTPEYGPVAFVVIGATMVGSILFTAEVGKTYEKGDELGYFAFGGSTCIAIFQKDTVVVDEDIISNSLKSLETLVKMGERVAVKRGSTFERTSSQKKQLALQTENSTVGISLFQGMTSADSAMLGEDRHSDGQSEEELSSAAFAGQQPGGGDGGAGGGWSFGGDQQGGAGGGQGVVGSGQPGGGDGVAGGGWSFGGDQQGGAGGGQGVLSSGQQLGGQQGYAEGASGQGGGMQQSFVQPGLERGMQQQAHMHGHAASIDSAQQKQPTEPAQYSSEEGISHFAEEAQQSPEHAKDVKGAQQVGHGSMSAFQASLPVGVSMTHDSSQ